MVSDLVVAALTCLKKLVSYGKNIYNFFYLEGRTPATPQKKIYSETKTFI